MGNWRDDIHEGMSAMAAFARPSALGELHAKFCKRSDHAPMYCGFFYYAW